MKWQGADWPTELREQSWIDLPKKDGFPSYAKNNLDGWFVVEFDAKRECWVCLQTGGNSSREVKHGNLTECLRAGRGMMG